MVSKIIRTPTDCFSLIPLSSRLPAYQVLWTGIWYRKNCYATLSLAISKYFLMLLHILLAKTCSFVSFLGDWREWISPGVGVNSMNLYIIFRNCFFNSPLLIWIPGLFNFQDFSHSPPTIWTPSFIRHCRVRLEEM